MFKYLVRTNFEECIRITDVDLKIAIAEITKTEEFTHYRLASGERHIERVHTTIEGTLIIGPCVCNDYIFDYPLKIKEIGELSVNSLKSHRDDEYIDYDYIEIGFSVLKLNDNLSIIKNPYTELDYFEKYWIYNILGRSYF